MFLCNPVSSNKLNGNNSWRVPMAQGYKNAQTIGRIKTICSYEFQPVLFGRSIYIRLIQYVTQLLQTKIYKYYTYYCQILFSEFYQNVHRQLSHSDEFEDQISFPDTGGIIFFVIASNSALASKKVPIHQVQRALSLEVKRPKREAVHSP